MDGTFRIGKYISIYYHTYGGSEIYSIHGKTLDGRPVTWSVSLATAEKRSTIIIIILIILSCLCCRVTGESSDWIFLIVVAQPTTN